jgi:hypothetical protein
MTQHRYRRWIALTATLAWALAAAPPAARAQVDVLTYHNDLGRTGQNLLETTLTPANVGPTTFGRLYTRPVDGYVYAQPLYVSGLTIPGLGTHDVVYVATENDTVYAFDATGTPRRALWRRRLIVPHTGGRAVNSSEVGCNDLVPKIGVTSTPVIDRASSTLYVVAKTKEKGRGNFVQRLHALDLATGAEKLGGPVVISATLPGTGDGSVGGMITYDPLLQHQRSSLALVNGVVYISSAAHCDIGPYHGWMIGYHASDLSFASAYVTTPDGGLGGVWESGGAPAADDSGNLYVETGNGTFDANSGGNDYGDSLLKLTPNGTTLDVADYFTPFNQDNLNQADTDFGSGGPLLLPDQPGVHQHEAIACGKEGSIYLVDREAMGHFHAGDDSQIVQSLPDAIGGTWSSPAYWNGMVYYSGSGDSLKAFSLTNGLLSTSPVGSAPDGFGFPGATPSISANGNGDGIVWTLQTDGYANGQPVVLHAYDASDVSQVLYASSQNGRHDVAGKAVKFAVPTIANGRVFVGAQKRLTAYGLKP